MMFRRLPSFALALALFLPRFASAQDAEPPPSVQEEAPPISITSPDAGSTYVFGSLKSRSLFWNGRDHVLVARVTFTDADLLDNNSSQDDTLEFRLPGVAFDAAKGIFSATTAKGEVIPVARIKKQLFLKTIEILPNARVRVLRERGTVNVILEAISPNDPAMHLQPANPNGEHAVDIRQILN